MRTFMRLQSLDFGLQSTNTFFMAYTTKNIGGSQIEFTISVTPDECKPHLLKAAERLSARANIKGFRKGKAPYDIVKKEVGDMAILQEAIEPIIKDTFFQAVTAEKIETVGMPKIDIKKAAPDNDLEYVATVALMPSVKLPDLSKITVKTKDAVVDEKKYEDTLQAVRGMHAKEIVKNGAAEGTDKLVLDMDMLIDSVPVEGGQAKDYQVYLSEDHYIPGFNEHVTGLKKGDNKEFQLTFPKEHYQKHLAGKTVDIKVVVKDVFERQLPELSDELAEKLGQKSVEDLKKLIRNNMLEEAQQKATQATEVEMLDKLVEKATFDDIPDVIVDSERQKMFYELKRDLERNGITVEQYLQDIKKKEDELYNDFKEQATKRAKAALLSRQVAKEQDIVIDDKELEAEITMMKEMYKQSKEAQDNLAKPEVRDTIATSLQNRKVMAWLKEQIVEEKK